MKRGSLLIVAFIFISLFLLTPLLAYDGYGYDYGYSQFSLVNLAQNEWVNAALLFLLIFAVCWFVTQQVFRSSLGAAFVISFVLGIMGALGTLYMFGPIIPKVGWWVVALAIAIIVAILWFQFRRRGSAFWIILLGLALLWLLWLRTQLCPYILPHVICVVLDAVSIAILLVAIIMLLIWLLGKLKPRGTHVPLEGGRERPEPNVLRVSVHGNGTTNPSPGDHSYRANQKVRVRAIPRRGSRFEKWILDGNSAGAPGNPVIDVIMNTGHHLIAVFSGEAEPISVTITAEPNRVGRGTPFILRWSSRNADWVEIEPRIGRVDRSGSRRIPYIDKTMTFTATARNRQGQSAEASCRVEVMEALPGPTAKPETGGKPRTEKLFINLRVDRDRVRSGEKVRARVTWRGGEPPYNILWYAKDNPVSQVREVSRRESTANIRIEGNVGDKVKIGVLVEGADRQLKEADKEIRIIE